MKYTIRQVLVITAATAATLWWCHLCGFDDSTILNMFVVGFLDPNQNPMDHCEGHTSQITGYIIGVFCRIFVECVRYVGIPCFIVAFTILGLKK